jgi:hypothetical protein
MWSTDLINRNYSKFDLYDVNTNTGNRIVNNANSLELKVLTSHTTTSRSIVFIIKV